MGPRFDDDTTLIEREAFEGFAGATRSLLVYHHDGADLVSLVPNVPTTIGRSSVADLVIRGDQLSRRHARFELVDGVVWVHDLGSTNGTHVNGEPVREPVRVGFDDEIRLGTVVVRVTPVAASEGRTYGLDRHDVFVGALHDELVRARTFGRHTALLLVHASGVGGEAHHRWVPGVRAMAREVDRVGLYGPKIVEICRSEADLAEAVALARRIVTSQPPSLPALRCGIAVYPQAGRTVDELFSAARDALHGATPDEPVQMARACLQVSTVADRPDEHPVLRSPVMVELFRKLERIAPSTVPVLLLGERGCGKDYAARQVHARSGRSGPMLAVNCGGLGDDAEAVLFGSPDRAGALEAAHGGTLLLDEIGELSHPAQLALVRAMDARRFVSRHRGEEVELDVRIVAATSCDLEGRVRIGRFREDLLARLHAMPLRLPPLRERLADIPALANHFVEQAAFEYGRSISGIAPTVLARLLRHPWPGNVRELRNVLQRAVLIAIGDRVEVADLPVVLQPSRKGRGNDDEVEPGAAELARDTVSLSLRREELGHHFKYNVRTCETALIRNALRRAEGDHAAAATLLGLSQQTLSYKVHDYGIDANRGDPGASAVLARLTEPEDKELGFRERIERIEARLVRAAMTRNDGDVAAAARELGLHVRTLEAKLQKLTV